MSVAHSIQQKLEQALELQHLEVVNESHMHAGPATESHFKLTVVADDFRPLNPVKRHQLLYRLLKEELDGPVHALALHVYMPEEWAATGQAPDSPRCRGGSKAENTKIM